MDSQDIIKIRVHPCNPCPQTIFSYAYQPATRLLQSRGAIP
jgi:hypothetical protein